MNKDGHSFQYWKEILHRTRLIVKWWNEWIFCLIHKGRWNRMNERINEWMNQSIHQSVNQSVNQLTNKQHKWIIARFIVKYCSNQSVSNVIKWLVSQSVNLFVEWKNFSSILRLLLVLHVQMKFWWILGDITVTFIGVLHKVGWVWNIITNVACSYEYTRMIMCRCISYFGLGCFTRFSFCLYETSLVIVVTRSPFIGLALILFSSKFCW